MGVNSYYICDSQSMYTFTLALTWPLVTCQIFQLKFYHLVCSPAFFKPLCGGTCLFLVVRVIGFSVSSVLMGPRKVRILEIIQIFFVVSAGVKLFPLLYIYGGLFPVFKDVIFLSLTCIWLGAWVGGFFHEESAVLSLFFSV